MPITIRRAGPEDAEQVADLIHRLLAELKGASPAAAAAAHAAVCRELLANENRYAAFLACDGARPVGALTLCESGAVYALGRFGTITEFYVTPEVRSSGVGRKLLKDAAAYGRARGWKRLEVSAPPLPRWERTLRFYLANDFTETGPRLRLML